jgi:hypothetical protein
MLSGRTPLFVIAALLSGIAAPALAAPAPQAAHVDQLNARLLTRAADVEARLATATRARRVTPAQATALRKKIDWVRKDSAKYVKQQGFLSAGEAASYDRTLGEVEAKLAR